MKIATITSMRVKPASFPAASRVFTGGVQAREQGRGRGSSAARSSPPSIVRAVAVIGRGIGRNVPSLNSAWKSLNETRRAEARLVQSRRNEFAYQLPVLGQEPLLVVLHVRVVAPSEPFVIVKLLVDFEWPTRP